MAAIHGCNILAWASVTIFFFKYRFLLSIIKDVQKQNFKVLSFEDLDILAEEMSEVAKFTAKYIFSFSA